MNGHEDLPVLRALARFAEERDGVTAHHCARVAVYAGVLAKAAGLEDWPQIQQAAECHDVGKVGVPLEFLRKPGRLTPKEYELIKEHPAVGWRVAGQGNTGRPLVDLAAIVAYSHHERWDGTGYPRGLEGEEIHIAARVVSLADTWDSMTSARTYRRPLTLRQAREQIERGAGTQFDPTLADAFLVLIDAGLI